MKIWVKGMHGVGNRTATTWCGGNHGGRGGGLSCLRRLHLYMKLKYDDDELQESMRILAFWGSSFHTVGLENLFI